MLSCVLSCVTMQVCAMWPHEQYSNMRECLVQFARLGSAMGDHRGITPTITSYTGIRIALQHSMHMYDTFGLKCGP